MKIPLNIEPLSEDLHEAANSGIFTCRTFVLLCFNLQSLHWLNRVKKKNLGLPGVDLTCLWRFRRTENNVPYTPLIPYMWHFALANQHC